jgi:hypothetical protein
LEKAEQYGSELYMDNLFLSPGLFNSLTKRNLTVVGQSDLTERNVIERCLLPAFYLTCSFTLKMGVVCSPQMLLDFPEESTHSNLFCMFLQENPE